MNRDATTAMWAVGAATILGSITSSILGGLLAAAGALVVAQSIAMGDARRRLTPLTTMAIALAGVAWIRQHGLALP